MWAGYYNKETKKRGICSHVQNPLELACNILHPQAAARETSFTPPTTRLRAPLVAARVEEGLHLSIMQGNISSGKCCPQLCTPQWELRVKLASWPPHMPVGAPGLLPYDRNARCSCCSLLCPTPRRALVLASAPFSASALGLRVLGCTPGCIRQLIC